MVMGILTRSWCSLVPTATNSVSRSKGSEEAHDTKSGGSDISTFRDVKPTILVQPSPEVQSAMCQGVRIMFTMLGSVVPMMCSLPCHNARISL